MSFLMAIEKGHSDAMFELGNYYNDQSDFDNMKKYYLMAIEKSHYNLF
jgi:TPR repeat protein